jgi:hypothetical protein
VRADERPEPGPAGEQASGGPADLAADDPAAPDRAAADPAATADELARLRAERDALQSRLDALEHKAHRQGRIRATAVGVLVVITCLSLVAGVVGVWARRNFLDTDRFVERVGPLAEDPAVQEVVTARLTDQLMVVIDPRELFEEVLPERGQLLAAPLANAVEGFVRDRVATFVRSDAFRRLWVGAATVAHRTAVRVVRDESDVVTAGGGQVTLNLVPVVNEVLARITAASPEILGREVDLPDVTLDDVPEAAVARIEDALGVDLGEDFGQFTVYDDGTLEAAQQAVSLADRLVVLLLGLALVCAALALWLSHRRRRTLLQISVAVAVGMVLIRRVGFRVDEEVAALPPTPEGRRALAVVAEQFLDPLTTFALWTLTGAALVAGVAVLTADYPWVVALRRRVAGLWDVATATAGRRARDEATVSWIAAHRDQLLAGGAVAGLAILWWGDLSWLGLLLVVALVGAFELAVHRIALTPSG